MQESDDHDKPQPARSVEPRGCGNHSLIRTDPKGDMRSECRVKRCGVVSDPGGVPGGDGNGSPGGPGRRGARDTDTSDPESQESLEEDSRDRARREGRVSDACVFDAIAGMGRACLPRIKLEKGPPTPGPQVRTLTGGTRKEKVRPGRFWATMLNWLLHDINKRTDETKYDERDLAQRWSQSKKGLGWNVAPVDRQKGRGQGGSDCT